MARSAEAQQVSLPPPLKGWNSRDNIDAMAPGYAVQLDNWVPRNDSLETRSGSTAHVTGLPNAVRSLWTHTDEDGSERLFAASDNAIYNVSSSTASLVLSGFSSNDWQTTQLDGATVICNGADAPYYYTVSTGLTICAFTDPSSPGAPSLDITNLAQVTSYKGRLYFVEGNLASLRYGDDGAFASGDLEWFPVGKLLQRGGPIEWVASWTRDTGAASQDLLVVMSRNGEMLVFSGAYPGAADWTLVAKFINLGKPLGRRSYFWEGPDLVIITEMGTFPLSQVLRVGQANEYASTSDAISKSFNSAAKLYSSFFGWSGLPHKRNQIGIINVPISESETQQYIYNPTSRAWARWIGLNCQCFAIFGGQLYGGTTTGKVLNCDLGLSDEGRSIECTAQWAYSYLGQPGAEKHMINMRPTMRIVGDIILKAGFDVDYRFQPNFCQLAISGNGTPWNAAAWNTFKWSSGIQSITSVIGAGALGSSISPILKTSINGSKAELTSLGIDFITSGSW